MTENLTNVHVPNWGMSAGEAVVVNWMAAVGDRVAVGDSLLELDAEKAIVVVESLVSGVLVEIVAVVDDVVTPGDVIARVRTPA